MNGRVVLVGALPQEIKALVRGTKADAALRRQGIHLHMVNDVIVVAGGMGAGRVTLAVEAVMRLGGAATLVTIGVAGGCSAEIVPGTVLEAKHVVQTQTGERFETAAAGDAVLVTTDAVVGVREKARLHAAYGASMVDMEAATVARLAAMRGLAFRAIKAISDPHDFEIASLNRFTTNHGHFHTRAFVMHTALRPHTWRKTARLGKHSQVALRALTERLKAEFGL